MDRYKYDELFELVDKDDRVIGTALRSECHGDPALIHRTAHVIVFSSNRELLLQKRTVTKDIQPGKWDTAVGGHLVPGEDYKHAARRELGEELGISADLTLDFLFHHRIRNEIESENTAVFFTVYDGPFSPDPGEIDEVRFWTKEQLLAEMENSIFTPNLVEEIKILLEKKLL